MSFIHDDFMLHNKASKKLYHDYAKHKGIIDYHCHLSPQEIFENKTYKNITQLWLAGDHYKWRLMRLNNIKESEITGKADDKTKFFSFAKTISKAVGNPLYHWVHLELKRYFDIDELLNEKTADFIWNSCNQKLQKITCNTLISKSNVKMIGTTDDPIDKLDYHLKIKENNILQDCKILPSFRPDKALNLNDKEFKKWLKKLEESSNISINSYDNLVKALYNRIDFFNSLSCKASDHALDIVRFAKKGDMSLDSILENAILDKEILENNLAYYQTSLLIDLAKKYKELNWVMQLHIGALRNSSSKMLVLLGKDTGFDSINDQNIAVKLVSLLDKMDQDNFIPKTILYSLNPNDNEILATICGSFAGGNTLGKMQFGSAWWFNDYKAGIQNQINTLANFGILSNFIGMLTDSRSFLSYTRHEYFRRILCNYLGELVELNEIPNDIALLGKIVENICFDNANAFFNLNL